MSPKSFPLFSHLLVFILGIHWSFETRPFLILLDHLFAHDFGASILVEQQGDQIRFHSKKIIDEKSYTVQHFQKYFGLTKVVFRPLKNTYRLRNKYLDIIDGDWILQTQKIKPH